MSLGSLFLPLFSGLAVATAWVYLRDDIARLKRVTASNVWLWLTLDQCNIVEADDCTRCCDVFQDFSIALYTSAEIAILARQPLASTGFSTALVHDPHSCCNRGLTH
ncbi:hypothetical protein O9992_24900 [Vibrio lentus]|nr:hypothetical protein [Vibrio lentus]